jgi:hypothetical protein
VNYRFACLGIAGSDTPSVESGLAVVDATVCGQANQDVLIEKTRVVRHSVDVSRPHKHRPRTVANKLLTRNSCERFDQALVHRTDALYQKLGEEFAVLLDCGHETLDEDAG